MSRRASEAPRTGPDTVDVLQVITSTDRRGAEVFATDLERALTDRGRSVRTVALVRGRQEGGLDVPTLGTSRLGIATLRALRAEARHAGLVVAHGSTTLPACALATTGTRTPFVYRNVGDPAHWGTTPARRLRSVAFLRRTSAVVALTAATAGELNARYRVSPEKIRVIPKGVPTERFTPATAEARRRARAHFELLAEAPVALYLGALSPEKNVRLAIEAVASIPGLHLLVVGDGPERSAAEAEASRVAPDRVHVAGPTDQPELALAAADVVVLTSHTEGLPGALIEAGLCGLPVVTTDVGFVREIVADTMTGYVVPPGDRAGFADALERALRAPSALGSAARRRCLERFSIDRVADAWDDLISAMLQ
ncbi:MAG: glycosyltransferase family 4 protein [Acidimicrobiia bacterium]